MRQTQPMPIYIIEENHFGQVIQQALMRMPTAAIDPDNETHQRTYAVTERHHAERRVGSGDQDKNHEMVHFLQNPVDPGGNIKGMIECAGSVEQDHAGDEYCHGGCADRISCPMSPNQQRSGPGSCGNNADKMSDRTSPDLSKKVSAFLWRVYKQYPYRFLTFIHEQSF